jgi:BlaI family transcriptional regulator, penicillinase repressor
MVGSSTHFVHLRKKPLTTPEDGATIYGEIRSKERRPVEDIAFTPRELDVMSILWRRGSATVAEVRAAMGEELAYTSVLSVLQVLEEKGFVHHEAEGRAYRYSPTVAPERAGDNALARIREAIFQGSAELMFVQFVSDRGLKREELESMRRLLDERLEGEP